MKMQTHLTLSGLVLFLVSCQATKQLFDNDTPTPREQYVRNLEQSNLEDAAMVKEWLRAGSTHNHDSVIVLLPFREVGFFPAAEPQARFYRFEAKEGQILTLTSLIKSNGKAKVFIDLFMLQDTMWTQVEHADSTLTITHEFQETKSFLVRIQPELLADVYYSITMSVTPVLLNPVKGASNKSIGSFYGDPRDGGKRKHEGIDIFASKGTLVVAPTDGLIHRVGVSNIGGKTVWMYDTKRGHSYYFAHLDSQMVKQGMKVKQGDVIGTVGNTGNAKYTPSHLHFGVYQKSSKDPVAYIRTMEKLVNEMTPDTLFKSLVFRVIKNNTPLRSGPSPKLPAYYSLDKNVWLKVIAQSGEWFRASTGIGKEGYVLKSYLMPAEKGKPFALQRETLLFSKPDTTSAPIASVDKKVELLARSNNFLFVKSYDGRKGWIFFDDIPLRRSEIQF